MGYFFGYSSTSLLILLPALLLSLYAQSKVKNTFNKYSRVANRRGYTGKDIAEMILRREGLYDIRVEPISGALTDHFNSKTRRIALSNGVYNSTSLAALGVAAHECGHATQHKDGYSMLMLRDFIVPAVNFGNRLSMPMIFLGVILGYLGYAGGIGYLVIQLGILLFSLYVIFQLITLPVELNASKRAIAILLEDHYLDESEILPAKKVLNAAALTYIAAAALAIANLLRLLSIFGGRRK